MLAHNVAAREAKDKKDSALAADGKLPRHKPALSDDEDVSDSNELENDQDEASGHAAHDAPILASPVQKQSQEGEHNDMYANLNIDELQDLISVSDGMNQDTQDGLGKVIKTYASSDSNDDDLYNKFKDTFETRFTGCPSCPLILYFKVFYVFLFCIFSTRVPFFTVYNLKWTDYCINNVLILKYFICRVL